MESINFDVLATRRNSSPSFMNNTDKAKYKRLFRLSSLHFGERRSGCLNDSEELTTSINLAKSELNTIKPSKIGSRIKRDFSLKSSPLSSQIDEKQNHFDGFLPYYQALVRSISPNFLSVLERRRSKHSSSKHYIRVATIYGWISSPPDSPVKNDDFLKQTTLKSSAFTFQNSSVRKSRLGRLGWIFSPSRYKTKEGTKLVKDVEFGLWADTLLPEKIAPLNNRGDIDTSVKSKSQTSSKKLFLSGFKKDLSQKWDSEPELSRISTNESLVTPAEILVSSEKSESPVIIQLNKEPAFSQQSEQIAFKQAETAEMQKIQVAQSKDENPELSDGEIPVWKEDSPQPVIYSIGKSKSILSKNEKVLLAGTIETLIEKLTGENDYEFLSDFFMSYRSFMSPVQLCKTLGARLKWALDEDNENGRFIQIRTYSAIRHWLVFYFDYDYVPSRALRFTMVNLLKDLQIRPKIVNSPEVFNHVVDVYECYKREKNASMKRNHTKSTYDLNTTKSFSSDLENKIASNLQARLSATINNTPSVKVKKNRKSQETLAQSSIKTILNSDEKGREANLWTMKMTCGLANLKVRLPEVYNSIASGVTNSDSLEDKSESIEPLFAEESSQLPESPTKQTLDAGGCSPRQSQQNLKSFILSYSTEIIAQQFCIIEQRYLCAVEWHELVEVLWKDRSDEVAIKKCHGVLAQIDRFNMMSQWVATEIVTLKLIEERARVIEKLIRIAMRCYQHRNYSTLLQMVLGLQSSSISRLVKTWSKVGSHEKRMLEELKEFTSPCKNWKNIREAMQKASEDYKFLIWSKEPEVTMTSKCVGPINSEKSDCQMVGEACIPFFGLFLSDLTYNAELPSHIEYPTKMNDNTTLASTIPALVQDRPQLINFNKHRITATIIKRLLSFQSLSQRYPFRPDVSVFPKCVFIRYYEDSEIRQLSLECEK